MFPVRRKRAPWATLVVDLGSAEFGTSESDCLTKRASRTLLTGKKTMARKRSCVEALALFHEDAADADVVDAFKREWGRWSLKLRSEVHCTVLEEAIEQAVDPALGSRLQLITYLVDECGIKGGITQTTLGRAIVMGLRGPALEVLEKKCKPGIAVLDTCVEMDDMAAYEFVKERYKLRPGRDCFGQSRCPRSASWVVRKDVAR